MKETLNISEQVSTQDSQLKEIVRLFNQQVEVIKSICNPKEVITLPPMEFKASDLNKIDR